MWSLCAALASAQTPPAFDDRSADLPWQPIDSTTSVMGAAWLDHDGDGDLDLFVANGVGLSTRLYRNDGDGRFTDVSAAAGADLLTGVSGVLAADLDNDGDPDLVLAGDRPFTDPTPMRLLWNEDGVFVDGTLASGLPLFTTTSAVSAGDANNDGLLDLFVAVPGSIRDKTQPANHLLHNRGDRVFTDVSAEAGITTAHGACASAFAHLDDDPFIDLVVANCNDVWFAETPLELHRNQGDGSFVEVTTDRGLWALGYWMGLALGDFDRDRSLDVFATNIGGDAGGPHALYLQDRDGRFEHRSAVGGVAEDPFGWGATAEDLDNDGDLDLYYVGAGPGRTSPSDPGASPGLLYLGRGDGSFEAPTVPLDLLHLQTGGVASADYDGDGAVDLLVVAGQDVSTDPPGPGQPVLLRNRGGPNGWLTVTLQGTTSNAGGIGSRVFARARGEVQRRDVRSGGGAFSTHTPWPTFGLADAEAAELCVRWPSGAFEHFGLFEARQRVVLVEGTGEPAAACPADTLEGPAEPPPPPTGCATVDGRPGWASLIRRR